MKNLILSILIILIGCSDHSETQPSEIEIKPEKMEQEEFAKVTGIGGIFFKSNEPQKMKEWYNKNLGIVSDEYGSLFSFLNPVDSNVVNFLQWSPFLDSTDYFSPSDKEFMINYRVKNIEALVETLKENGVTIVDSIEAFGEYGKFVHVMGPENHKLELWEQPENL